ncbi:organic solute transporter Ostalpha-domain-containing protein [Xylariales sp. AK1849]|nr:organic solute transporter Ostalpha-domain-containing protein [Xylariales sp. AK1849]
MGNHHSKTSNDNTDTSHVCDEPGFDTLPTETFVGSLDFYHFNMILSGACAVFSCAVLFALMFRHATHFSRPKEQADILRICAFIPIYAIGTLIEVCAPRSYIYLQPWLEVAQACALACFFILLCRLLSSETDQRQDVFLAPMKLVQEKKEESTTEAVARYRRTWIRIFQYPVIAVLIAIFTAITEGADKYCFGSREPYFASLWLEILGKISVATAVISVLQTYSSLKVELRPFKAIQKLLAFKLLIGLQFIQGIVYMILQRVNPSPLEPTATLSYTDMQIGIPLLLVSCELGLFSVFFHLAYSVTPYRLTSYSHKLLSHTADGNQAVNAASYQGGPLCIRAWLAVLNPKDFFAAIIFSFNIKNAALTAGNDSASSRPLNPYPYRSTQEGSQPQPPPDYTYDPSYGTSNERPELPRYGNSRYGNAGAGAPHKE